MGRSLQFKNICRKSLYQLSTSRSTELLFFSSKWDIFHDSLHVERQEVVQNDHGDGAPWRWREINE